MGNTRFSYRLKTKLQNSMIIYKNVILTEILPCPMVKRGFAYTDSKVNVIEVIDTNHYMPNWPCPKKNLFPWPVLAWISMPPYRGYRG